MKIISISSKQDVAHRMTMPLEVRFDSLAKAGAIEGYASAFGGPPDSYGDIIAPGAFSRTLKDHQRERTTPAMLWAHDQSKPIGRWIEMREDDHGLLVRGALNLDTQAGRDAQAHARNGDVTGFSIGFAVSEKGIRRDGPVQHLTDIDLIEISMVALPANRRARITGVKTLGSKSELIDLLQEGGIAKAAARRIASGGWAALTGEDHQKAIELAAEIQRATEAWRMKS